MNILDEPISFRDSSLLMQLLLLLCGSLGAWIVSTWHMIISQEHRSSYAHDEIVLNVNFVSSHVNFVSSHHGAAKPNIKDYWEVS